MSITRIKSLDTQNDLMLQVSFCARMMTTASPYPLILRVAEACWTSLLPHLQSCIRFAGLDPTMFIDVFLRSFNARVSHQVLRAFSLNSSSFFRPLEYVMKHGLLPRTRLNIPSKSSFIDFSDGFQQCLRYCCCVKSRVLKSVRRL